MSRPGEYEFPEIADYDHGGGNYVPVNVDCKGYNAAFLAAVEKAQGERNCGNCAYMEEAKSVFDDHDLCKKHGLRFPVEGGRVIDTTEILKCNEWKSKEAGNGD